jgi:hypothetical protein
VTPGGLAFRLPPIHRYWDLDSACRPAAGLRRCRREPQATHVNGAPGPRGLGRCAKGGRLGTPIAATAPRPASCDAADAPRVGRDAEDHTPRMGRLSSAILEKSLQGHATPRHTSPPVIPDGAQRRSGTHGPPAFSSPRVVPMRYTYCAYGLTMERVRCPTSYVGWHL